MNQNEKFQKAKEDLQKILFEKFSKKLKSCFAKDAWEDIEPMVEEFSDKVYHYTMHNSYEKYQKYLKKNESK